MKTLLIGDPHIQVQRLDDGVFFLNNIRQIAEREDVSSIIFLGDLFHTFAVIRVEVMSVWNSFFKAVEKKFKIISLVGNHDYSGKSGGFNALEVFGDRIHVVDRQYISLYLDGVYLFPFMRDDRAFEEECKKIEKGSLLICHQTFAGVVYGSGYEEKEGVSIDCVKHLGGVISGHIHKRQVFANIWYPGIPMQHSFADTDYDCRVFVIDIDAKHQKGYKQLKEINLNLPRYIKVETASTEAMFDALPQKPDRRDSYKLVSKGTPAEITAFWRDPRAIDFRKSVRRVVDSIVPERGELPDEIFKEYGTKEEKLTAFIQSREWRTSRDSVTTAAGAFLSI